MSTTTATHFKGATIVTMDPRRGTLPKGDLIVRGGRIAAIGQSLVSPPGAQVIDCTGRILIPGLVNAHMHTWQTGLRGLAANWTLLEYFGKVHAGLATLFEPEDLYIATRMGAINQIDCGTTTLGDWCHNNPTPAHTDAALDGLIESDIRGVFMHGSPKPDPKPGEPHFSEIPHPRSEIERLSRGRIRDRRRIGLAMAILGPHYSTLEVAFKDFEMAREFGLVASMHQGGGPAKSPGGWDKLEAAGLVGKGVNIVHGHGLSEAQIARFSANGVSFSTTPENEMTQGHGFPVTGKVRAAGGLLSLGVDLESVLSGDMFTVARMALGMQRALDNAESRETRGQIPATTTIPVEEALRWITIDGARALGLDHRIGSLETGKEADITVIDARAMNMTPVLDPVSSVVMQAGPRNVEHVMILGEFAKRDHALTRDDVGEGLEALGRSGHRIAAELARRTGAQSKPAAAKPAAGARPGDKTSGAASGAANGAATKRVAWIGLGKLGLPMAARIAADGHSVHGFDLDAGRVGEAEGRGIARSASLAAAVEGADIVFASLPDDRALDAAVGREGALLDCMSAGTILVETSTVSVAASAAIAGKAEARGIPYLRSPVSGNPVTAEAGELSAMVSGPRDAFERAEPVMASFCKAQAYFGDAEQGRVAKLAINLMIAVSAGMMGEALALAQRHDIEWGDMLALMESSAIASPMVKYKCLPLKSRDYTSTFSGRQMAKDLDLILEAARHTEVPVPLAAQMRQTYSAMMATGTAEDDYVATVKHLEMLSGLSDTKRG